MTYDEFLLVWAKYLAAAMEEAGNTHGPRDVWAMIHAGDAAYWPGEQSAVITDLMITPKVKAVNVWLMGGNLYDIKRNVMPRIEHWARLHKLDAIMGSGRDALERVVRDMGFVPVTRTYVKELR